jgi:hypothetical protein
LDRKIQLSLKPGEEGEEKDKKENVQKDEYAQNTHYVAVPKWNEEKQVRGVKI